MASQPLPDASYTAAGNPVDKEPAERAQALRNAAAAGQSSASSSPTETRGPADQTDDVGAATASSLGRGVRGADRDTDNPAGTGEDFGRQGELDAEQMAAPGEGRVADAVGDKTFRGASGSAPDPASDLDRKKAEQAQARGEIQGERRVGVDVDGGMASSGALSSRDNNP